MTADELQQQICDLFWRLMEPWDDKIAEHDEELHRLLRELRQAERIKPTPPHTHLELMRF